MIRTWKPGSVVAALCALMVSVWSSDAASVDLHRLFEERCAGCHGHAGDFARETFTVVDGGLRGRHTDLRAFLKRHQGQQTDEEVEGIYALFLKQVQEGGRFKNQCGMCHQKATRLARKSLIVVDGELRGRYTGNTIRTFLLDHGRLDAQEAAFFYDVLLEVTQGRR
jgi:hypothetical protein